LHRALKVEFQINLTARDIGQPEKVWRDCNLRAHMEKTTEKMKPDLARDDSCLQEYFANDPESAALGSSEARLVVHLLSTYDRLYQRGALFENGYSIL